jgi:voltage-gated potassium channel
VKSLGLILTYLAGPQGRRNLRLLAVLMVLFVVTVGIYSTLFHVLMEHEGQQFSWPTAVYWTVVTMSTLGFGDITFESDAGRIFSVVVLLSGSAFILVLLPFAFLQFVFVPWMEARQQSRAPRELPQGLSGHVLLTDVGPIEQTLIRRLDRSSVPYAAIVGDVDQALKLHDEGYDVMVGPLDDPATFRAAGVERASLVAVTHSDTTNTNVAFTVQEISASVPVVATANSHASVDILKLAGCDRVLQLGEMLGTAMAQRVLIPGGRSLVIGRFGDLLVAEASAPTALLGRPLLETGLRQSTGLNVAGVLSRGGIQVARPTTVLAQTDTLVLAGTRAQLDRYDEQFGVGSTEPAPVVVVGGGRVGRAAAAALRAGGFPTKVVEQQADRVRDPEDYVVGDAAELSVLEEAGIRAAGSVIITTHDDDVNVYLTIYCRLLRPDIQIISRSRLDRNVSTLHRAGADSVLSYASTGAAAIWNELSPDNTLQLAEGLDVFRVPVPTKLVGRTLADSDLRDDTGCSVIAVVVEGVFTVPEASTVLPAGGHLVLIGDEASEERFFRHHRPPHHWWRRSGSR